MGRSDRIAGLLDVAEALMLHNGAPVGEVAKMLGVSRSRLEVLLEELSVCGVPPYDPGALIDAFVEGGRVYIENLDIFIDAARRLDRDEAAALLIGHDIAMAAPFSDDAALMSAFGKIRRAISGRLSKDLTGLGDKVASAPYGGRMAEILSLIRQSCGNHKLKIEYIVPGAAEPSVRVIRPLRLTLSRSRWYCIAWCEAREAMRIFRVDRIAQACRTGDGFAPSDEGGEIASLAWDVESPSMFEARLVFAAGAPADEARELWPEKTVMRSDGSVEVTMRMFDPVRAVPYVLSLGEGVSVESPDVLRQLVAKSAADALKLYE